MYTPLTKDNPCVPVIVGFECLTQDQNKMNNHDSLKCNKRNHSTFTLCASLIDDVNTYRSRKKGDHKTYGCSCKV